jgi:DNA/RNA-binding domain of Phe-tRNA-synthetase-like protein
MKLILDPHLFAVFPAIRIAVLHGVLARPAADSADLEKLDALRTSSLTKLKDAFPDVKSLDGDSRIELWKDTYKKMGVNPKKSKPTHWALASRLVKDGKWPRPIGPVIDVYLVNQM